MIYFYDPNSIHNRLQAMDKIRQLAFGIFLLERSMPNYLRFQVDSGAVGGGEYRAALAQCWAVLESAFHRHISFVSLSTCEALLPDTEDHTSVYTSSAVDAGNIACSLLSFVDTKEVSLLMEAVEARYDTFYLFISNEIIDDEEAILMHPLMQQELSFIEDDLGFLESMINKNSTELSRYSIKRVSELCYQKFRLELRDVE